MGAKKRRALRFIVLLGLVSLFADVTYEGARSITGPFMAILGASGAVVGVVAGLGELVGYGMRLAAGYFTDKTQRYWALTIFGYAVNLLAAPALAFAGSWQIAAVLIILERFGKAVRSPAKDTMLSFATKETGRGWGFGLHESLDQIGAIAGPLLISALLFFKESYQFGFAMLIFPALASLGVLAGARFSYPQPQAMESVRFERGKSAFSKTYWIYLLATGLIAAGYADFALIAYHFQKSALVPALWIPLFYSIAMAVDGLAALWMGKMFDVKGLKVLIFVTVLSAFFAPLVFLGGFSSGLAGMILWGIGMGSQESLLRAVVARLIVPQKRGLAYGMLHFGFGVFWFAGSALMGILYDVSIVSLVLFSVLAQLASIPLFLFLKRNQACQ